jgi:hypothetical protein
MEGAEYTNLVKDFGISNGNGGGSFLPESTAKKEEAVAMLIRMYQRLNSDIKELHAFYAIKSYGQAGMIQDLSSVSFGWSRLEYDNSSNKLSVATSKNESSDFFIPEGYGEPVNIAKQGNTATSFTVTTELGWITVPQVGLNTFVAGVDFPDNIQIEKGDLLAFRTDSTFKSNLQYYASSSNATYSKASDWTLGTEQTYSNNSGYLTSIFGRVRVPSTEPVSTLVSALTADSNTSIGTDTPEKSAVLTLGSPLIGIGSVIAVEPVISAKCNGDLTVNNLEVNIKQSTLESTPTNIVLPTIYGLNTHIQLPVNPVNGLPWTVDDIHTIELKLKSKA